MATPNSRWRRSFVVVPVLALVTALSLVACGGGADGGSAGSDGDDVTVVERGSEPRRELRLQAEAGQAFTSVMTMTLGMTMEVDGQPVPPQPLPDTRVTMEVSVDDVSDDGDISFSYRYASVEPVAGDDVDPAVVDAMRTALTQMQGITGRAVVSNRGVLVDSSIDASSVQDENMRAMVDSLSTQTEALTVPFPAEEVGRGATWRVTRQAKLMGIDTEMTLQYELVELEGETYSLAVEQEVTAAPGPADIPGVPAEAAVTIEDYLVKSTGSIDGTMVRILPARSVLEGAGDIRLRAQSGAESGTLVQHLDMRVELESQ